MRLFGTNGIREVVGERLTAPFVTSVATGIARTLRPASRVVVGMDGRTSSPAFARIVVATLALHGHSVVEIGMLPTPAIQYNVLQLGADMGVIVTASHNPPEFNGIKCIASDGLEVLRGVEEAIETEVAAGAPAGVPYDRIEPSQTDSAGASRYLKGILGQVDASRIRARKFTVVLDCGNGASTATSPELLRRLGCRVVTLNGNLDGTFPGHLSEPTEANLHDLIHAVPAIGADLGIAHDGDADRTVLVDAEGHYLPGEVPLTWLGKVQVERHHGGVVVTPVTASRSLEDAVRPIGGEVVYTRVGSPVVTREMVARKAVFGGEENGGLIFPGFQLARDGAMTAAAALDELARTGNSLAEAVRELPRYTLLKLKVECPPDLLQPVLRDVEARYRSEGGQLITIDGVKVVRSDGWILLRPSGTEPLIRIFAESSDRSRAEGLASEGSERVKSAIARLRP